MTKSEFEQSDDKVEAAHLIDALCDPVGWPQPPEGFEGRCLEALRIAQHGGHKSGQRVVESRRISLRLGRIAASITALASFVGFAMYCGVKYGLFDDDVRNIGVLSRADTLPSGDLDVLAQKGENTMILRKMAGVVGASVVSVAVSAAELTSEPTLVFTRPETSSFWNTATNNHMTVPVDFPAGATSATLTVNGLGYTATYADIHKGTDSYTFVVPAAESPQTENVYNLTLTFNDGTVRKAKLGLIEGVAPEAEGVTRCLAPANGRVWSRVKGGRVVFPIPHGTSSFSITVNGNTRTESTGLNGAQGWYALGLYGGEEASLSMIANGISYSASLLGSRDGLVVVFQ